MLCRDWRLALDGATCFLVKLFSERSELKKLQVKRRIRREFLLQRMLGIVVSKLQMDGIISFPCKLLFKSYFERFLEQLRANPWLDCDPPTGGDRRAFIIENMYSSFVNRSCIHRLFIEPGEASFAGKPFKVRLSFSLRCA